MLPLIAGALTALQLIERATQRGVWGAWSDSAEVEQLKTYLVEIEKQFAEICDLLGCERTLPAAMAEVRHWDRTLARLTLENAELREAKVAQEKEQSDLFAALQREKRKAKRKAKEQNI